MNSLTLNVAVIEFEGRMYALPTRATTPQGLDPDEKVISLCQIPLDEPSSDGVICPADAPCTSLYKMLMRMDEIYDNPHMSDLLMHFFMTGFAAGMKHQAEQEAKPITIVP